MAATVATDPEALPPLVSREAYRIVQEGLSNVLRHAGGEVAVALRVDVMDDHLRIAVENPLGEAGGTADTSRGPGGGHGLRGIADRARLLGGAAEAGDVGGTWRLHVRLPLKGVEGNRTPLPERDLETYSTDTA